MTMTTPIPIGDGTRDDSDGHHRRRCPICDSSIPSTRARFCSGACRMRAHRRRHSQPDRLAAALPAAWPIVYECSQCEQRYLAVRRCPDCNLFARRLGPGGLCSHCDEPLLLAELFDSAAT